MARFMYKVSYSKEGMQGVMKEGAVNRRAFIEKMAAEMGGSVTSFDFAFGDTDLYAMVEMPDHDLGGRRRDRGGGVGHREHRDRGAPLRRGHRSRDRQARPLPSARGLKPREFSLA